MIAIAVLSLLTTACYENVGVSLHSPGVYKGKTDELVKKSGSAELQEKLRLRVETIQTDR